MEWKQSTALIPYPEAIDFMEKRVEVIADGVAEECIWLLEHPPLFTSGTSARPSDLVDTLGFPVYEAGRGGQFTYHGPGQRVGYVMLNLKKRYAPAVPDIRDFVQKLEQWIIFTLADFGIEGFTREGRVGVWTNTPSGEAKIAAQGIRIRRGVSFHGIAINVHPDLSHYRGIIPCGIREYGVTSMQAMGKDITLAQLDSALRTHIKSLIPSP